MMTKVSGIPYPGNKGLQILKRQLIAQLITTICNTYVVLQPIY